MNENLQNQIFNEEMLTILKQQINKLKLMNNELELKDHQILLLKDTIKSLEQQKDSQLQQNENLKNNMRALIQEVNQRNRRYEEILRNLEQEKNKQLQQNERKTKTILENNTSIKKLTKDLREAEIRNEEIMRQIKQFKQKIKQYATNHKDSKIQADQQKREIKEVKQLNKKLTDEIQIINSQLAFSKQQFNIIKTKYEEALQTAQVRLRETINEKNKIKSYQTVQKNLEITTQKYNKQKMEIEKLKHELNMKQREILIVKEGKLTLQEQKTSQIQTIKVDIKNLSQLKNFNHKITQYMSIFGQQFQEIQKYYVNIQNKIEIVQKQNADLIQQNQKLKTQIIQKEQEFQELQKELDIIRMGCNNQLKKVEYQYQQKLVTLQLKLKQEEKQIQKLKSKDRQFHDIESQLQKLKKQTKRQYQTKQQQILQLNKENEILNSQLNQIYPLCQESIITKNKINLLKFTTANIIRLLFFVINKIKYNMQCNHFFKSLLYSEFKYESKLSGKRRFRKGVWSVVATIRLKNLIKKFRNLQKQSGWIKDKMIKKIIRQYYAYQQNQITSDYLDRLNNIIQKQNKNTSEDTNLVQEMLENYQEFYSQKSINTKFITFSKIVSNNSKFKVNEFRSKKNNN